MSAGSSLVTFSLGKQCECSRSQQSSLSFFRLPDPHWGTSASKEAHLLYVGLYVSSCMQDLANAFETGFVLFPFESGGRERQPFFSFFSS